jgi:hypothetical protein
MTKLIAPTDLDLAEYASLFRPTVLGTVERRKLIEQIRRLVITPPTKPLTSMKARMFDASPTLRSLEVRPTTTFHMHAYNACPTVRTGMTIGLSSSFASLGAQLPSLANEGRTARLERRSCGRLHSGLPT